MTTLTTAPWAERASAVLAPTYVRPETTYVAGEGAWLIDEEGNRHLAFTSGVAVNALGHGYPTVVAALQRAAQGLIHTSNLFHTRPAIALAEELVANSFASKVFFCNSGAESAEGMLKFGRLYGGEARRKVISFKGSFHGRTLGALTATDRPACHATFGPLPGHFYSAGFNDVTALEAIDAETCLVVVEPVQGEGGVRPAETGWLSALRARCDEVGALLGFDEVQCGLGRTGRLWAHEHTGVTPDLMALAKPLAGGLPMGAVLLNDRAAAAVRPGVHATTFGGGPFVASVALEVFRRLKDPELLAHVRRLEEQARAQVAPLEPRPVRCLRGRGLLLGLALTPEVQAADVIAAARRRGLLLVAARDNVVRVVPPLTISAAELEHGLDLLAASLAEVTA